MLLLLLIHLVLVPLSAILSRRLWYTFYRPGLCAINYSERGIWAPREFRIWSFNLRKEQHNEKNFLQAKRTDYSNS